MATPKTNYVKQLADRLEEIEALRTTPNIIKQQAISSLNSALKEQLTNSARQKLENSKQSLENIGDSSIAANYKIIFAQMCVLAVSSLEALLKRYFENVADNYRNIDIHYKKIAELKVSVKELIENDLKFGSKLGKTITTKDNQLNFQDLKSIKNGFSNYFGKTFNLDKEVQKQVCFYLEVRHLLVHRGGVVDEKFISAMSPLGANIKNYKANDTVSLDENDWDNIKKSFISLMTEITKFKPKASDETSI